MGGGLLPWKIKSHLTSPCDILVFPRFWRSKNEATEMVTDSKASAVTWLHGSAPLGEVCKNILSIVLVFREHTAINNAL